MQAAATPSENTTRSGLMAATIATVDGAIKIPCMFNPEHYTIKKANNFEENNENSPRRPPKPNFTSYGRSTLTLSTLYFDTYETNADLARITNQLWDLMRPVNDSDPDSAPPEIVFSWASFEFTAYIKDMSIKYTLFTKEGKPVRAEVTLSFIQSEDPTRYPHQNPTSGGGPIQQIRPIVYGDRLDLIADEVYGDATKWRIIAAYNHIINPLTLRPGQVIAIPQII